MVVFITSVRYNNKTGIDRQDIVRNVTLRAERFCPAQMREEKTLNKKEKNKCKAGTKTAAVFAAFILGAGMLTGCSFSKPTAESLLAASARQAAAMKTAVADMDLHFDMDISQGSLSLAMEMDVDGDIRYVREDSEHYKSHMNADTRVSLMGMSQNVQTENYLLCEDGEVTSYTKMADNDGWIKQSGGSGAMPGTDISKLANILSSHSLFTLQEDTVMEGDVECYVLTAEVAAGDLPFFENDPGMDLDLSGLKMYLAYKLDKKSKAPVSLTITVDENSFDKLLQDSLGNTLQGAAVDVKSFEMELKFVSINEDVTIDVPDEVYDAKEGQAGGLFDSFGSFGNGGGASGGGRKQE